MKINNVCIRFNNPNQTVHFNKRNKRITNVIGYIWLIFHYVNKGIPLLTIFHYDSFCRFLKKYLEKPHNLSKWVAFWVLIWYNKMKRYIYKDIPLLT